MFWHSLCALTRKLNTNSTCLKHRCPTGEFRKGSQPRHCRDEDCDLEEQEYLQVAFTAHLVARTPSHLHADGKAGHNGATGEEHDDGHQQRRNRQQEPEYERVMVQEPAKQHSGCSTRWMACMLAHVDRYSPAVGVLQRRRVQEVSSLLAQL